MARLVDPRAYEGILSALRRSKNEGALKLFEKIAIKSDFPDRALRQTVNGSVYIRERSILISSRGNLGTFMEELQHFRDLMVFENRGLPTLVRNLGLSPETEALARRAQATYQTYWGPVIRNQGVVNPITRAEFRSLFEEIVRAQVGEFFRRIRV